MNKLDVSPHTFALSPVSHSDPSIHAEPQIELRHHLIVLFPGTESDTPDLEHRIWEIARSLELNVLFLSLTNDREQESHLRRKLVTMAAVIKDPNISTDILIERGSDWVGQMRKVWQEGDIVACFEGQKVGLIRKSLDQILKSSLKTPIYILSNYEPVRNSKPSFFSRALFWLVSLAIIVGFLWAEITISQLPQDWTHTVLICVFIFVEVALIYLWNSLFI